VASYNLLIKPSAAKELESIPKKDRKRVAASMLDLASDPQPFGAEKLSAQEKYRVRQGDYRISYFIEDTITTVRILKIAHRGEVYR
jgi:mRNA interferase RelE/StbE